MGNRFLEDKVFQGFFVRPPDPNVAWQPANDCNDYYPKYLYNEALLPAQTHRYTPNLAQAFVSRFYQKDEFNALWLTGNNLIIEPSVHGWGISFENIKFTYYGSKYVLAEKIIPNGKDTYDFSDQFIRFGSMYTFDDYTAAGDDKKRKILKESLTY